MKLILLLGAFWVLSIASVHSAPVSQAQRDTASNNQQLSSEQKRKTHEEMLKDRHERLKERRSAFENRLFEQVDENGDGAISKSEFRKRADLRFQELDLNRDGKLSREELRHERPGPRRP